MYSRQGQNTKGAMSFSLVVKVAVPAEVKTQAGCFSQAGSHLVYEASLSIGSSRTTTWTRACSTAS